MRAVIGKGQSFQGRGEASVRGKREWEKGDRHLFHGGGGKIVRDPSTRRDKPGWLRRSEGKEKGTAARARGYRGGARDWGIRGDVFKSTGRRWNFFEKCF